MGVVQALSNPKQPAFGSLRMPLLLNAQRCHLIRVNPVVPLIVTLGRDLAMADGKEDGRSGHAGASNCLDHFHAIGHV